MILNDLTDSKHDQFFFSIILNIWLKCLYTINQTNSLYCNTIGDPFINDIMYKFTDLFIFCSWKTWTWRLGYFLKGCWFANLRGCRGIRKAKSKSTWQVLRCLIEILMIKIIMVRLKWFNLFVLLNNCWYWFQLVWITTYIRRQLFL